MRELSVRIKFTSPCLGNDRKTFRMANGKVGTHYLLARNPDGRVVFMQSWWAAIMRKAADIACRHHGEVKKIRFSIEVDGSPKPLVPVTKVNEKSGKEVSYYEGYYLRYYKEDRFAKHEAFFPGTIIGITCVVPDSINDEDFHELMAFAGKYCGISPARPGEFGYFTVESIRPTGTRRRPAKATELTKAEPPAG